MAGTLYLVATPIGNLEDLTFRAARVLREADLVACEDTRHTRQLLDHYGIRTPTISYHEHNEAQRTEQLLGKLRQGMNVALVSDAGTPLVSDPGYRLVAKALEQAVRVEPLPGASALLAALTASGMPTEQFHFAGFLPAKSGQRRKALEELKDQQTTLVLYEAPHRILETLADMEAILGKRQAVVAREITKLHEEFLRGPIPELRGILAARPSIKGEITLVVGKAGRPADETPVRQAIEQFVQSGMTRMEAIKAVARRRGLSKREVYKVLETTE